MVFVYEGKPYVWMFRKENSQARFYVKTSNYLPPFATLVHDTKKTCEYQRSTKEVTLKNRS